LNLARLYETAGELPSARNQFRALARPQRAAVSHAAPYIEFLLRHSDVAEADTWLRKLERIAPDSWAALQLRVRWLKAAGQAEKIEPLVEAAAERSLAKAGAEQKQFLLDVANVYASVELNEAAERWLRRLAREFPHQYTPLVRWLAQHDAADEAVGICLQVAQADTTPNAAILLAELLVQRKPKLASAEAVESVLGRAIETHSDDAGLLFAVSNVRLIQQRLDDATDLLQKVTRIQPDNYLAWNNLAVVLAERPNGQAEALRCINRAIEIAGRDVPSLIDTKAMILLHQGEVSEAIALLKQIVASPHKSDPRFYFHLALAFERNASIDSARETLQTANALGLSYNFLTPLEKNLLADLEKRVVQQSPLKDG
jgi:tetratricopeptide (TPR) repeat protein